MSADPDEELVRRVGAGEPEAVRLLVARKLPRILSLAVRMLGDAAEAEDVAQETFMRIWRHASGWRRGNARFDSWIHRVTLNLCYDRLRRRREWVTDAVPDIVDPAPLPDAREEPHRVEQALEAIAPRQREAIILVYYQEMSNIEAAATLEISVDALESLLSRGRRALHTILARDGAHE
ncbi:RNA polymerase sigma factor [Mesorhizobium sp. M8A.F.Ca.ET.208.01.1.1]|uniref:RNA polymerase sigma factor n=1 Tax=unclassified Mesorhizobium TaxID=325217 RepID=UPI001093593E|nr:MULTISPECIES: RNA polymerase sigma factor [unclassified Mesorhizobium]TGQ87958.1 RNA polymerase sigma factor [Mesorhizobium sp. M8A.F.Ca.ET.208.01.1.1]TGT49693.1 RNA polymerase sigma factor [Mesorhizobium sp. M8A.F.Ca.ET.167.01.1.1]